MSSSINFPLNLLQISKSAKILFCPKYSTEPAHCVVDLLPPIMSEPLDIFISYIFIRLFPRCWASLAPASPPPWAWSRNASSRSSRRPTSRGRPTPTTSTPTWRRSHTAHLHSVGPTRQLQCCVSQWGILLRATASPKKKHFCFCWLRQSQMWKVRRRTERERGRFDLTALRVRAWWPDDLLFLCMKK